MDFPKQQRLIAGIYLEILTGDVFVRNQFMSILLTQIATLIRITKLEPRQTGIEKFRTRLHETVSAILHNTHPLPIWNTEREPEIKKLMAYFDRFVIKIDEKVADEKGVEQIGILEDIEKIEYCRNLAYNAQGDFSLAMSGNPDGLTNASNKYAFIIDVITPTLYKYDLVTFGIDEFKMSAKNNAQKIEPSVTVKRHEK